VSDPNVQPKYRPDIDGLRAVAVLAVVGFHAFPDRVPGGFVGVDIFFVISGFLISTIVFGSLERGAFSFADFYARRIKRIFPALIVVLLATWAIGWRFLFPLEYANLGKHIAGGATFVSNLVLWRDSGYFDTAAETKPLLHLWSLAIEEQFYLVWPLALVLAWAFPRLRLVLVIAVACASFRVSLWATARNPVVGYYFPVTRFWELLIGALLAYARLFHASAPAWTARWLRGGEPQAIGGVLLIVAALFGIDRDSPFPGWLALLPTLGAFLLISAGPDTFINRRLLGARPMVGVGLISYPLYLWHWPLLTYARIVSEGKPSDATLVAAAVAAFPLAWFTYQFVEKPIRRGARDTMAIGLACGMAACLALGLAAARSVVPGKLDTPYAQGLAAAESDWSYPAGNAELLRVGTGDPQVLFIGDSHLQQYYPRVRQRIDTGRAPPAAFFTRGGCPPLPGVDRVEVGYGCDGFVAEATKLALADPRIRTVVIGAAWENYFLGIPPRETARGPLLYASGDSARTPLAIDSAAAKRSFDGLATTIAALRGAGKRVFVILNNATSEAFSPAVRYPDRVTLAVPERDDFVQREAFEAFARPVTAAVQDAARRGGAEIVDPVAALCETGRCPVVGADGVPLYKDSNHLRAGYARQAATYIDRTLE